MKLIEQCPACSGRAVTTVVRGDGRQRDRFLAYSRLKYGGLMDRWLDDIDLAIARCAVCGHHWYSQQPEASQLTAMYDASRPIFGGVSPSREPTEEMRRQMRSLRRLLASHPRPLLLDYGSGYGRWARAACHEGFEVCAYEPSLARGREDDVPFTVVHRIGDLGARRFDVVNIEQVLEHVPDPLQVLLEVKALCKPQTILRIAVPNLLRCHEGRRIWDQWPFNGTRVHTMAPFEHLHGFTPASLERVVRRAGFRLLSPLRTLKTDATIPLRRFAGRLWPRMGHTLVLVQVER